VLYQARDGNLYRRWEQHPIPFSDSDSPERAAFLELLLHDPEAAKRERLQARVAYWRRRVEHLQAHLAELRELLTDAELEPGAPAVDLWRGRVELDLALTDLMQATDRLAEAEREARAAGAKIKPFGWQPAPTPAPLIAPAGPRRPGPKVTCECGTCARCRAREAMRRRRAAAKMAKAARKRPRGAGGFTTPRGSVLPPRA